MNETEVTNSDLILAGVAALQHRLAEGSIPAEHVSDVDMGITLMQILASGAKGTS